MERNEDLIKWLLVLVGIIMTDFYFFPLTLRVLPYGNTKMLLALAAIVLLLFTPHKDMRNGNTLRPFIIMCVYALFVSFFTFVTVVVNNTHDYTYVSYIISMLVWLGGAYTLLRYLRFVHGDLSLRIVVFYLLAVCMLQCVSAILLLRYPVFLNWIDSIVVGQKDMMEYGGDERMFGISCGFDVAGIRFSSVLVLAFFFLKSMIIDKNNNYWTKALYCSSLVVITVIGNNIARTTTIGLILGLAYVGWQSLFPSDNRGCKQMWKWIVVTSLIGVLICIWLYHTDIHFRNNLRFGFEGFFSLVETGKWTTHSTEILQGMYVFPENLKTWFWGDGLFIDTTQEPWYVGPTYEGYYMGTDVGYLRFIFYFGTFGLMSFLAFLLYSMKVCIMKFPTHKILFYWLMLLQLIIFMKVATDIFMVFALCIACGFVCEQYGIKEYSYDGKETYSVD